MTAKYIIVIFISPARSPKSIVTGILQFTYTISKRKRVDRSGNTTIHLHDL